MRFVPVYISFLLILACLVGKAQKRLTCYEKRWAFFHPFAALKVKKISKACYVLYRKTSLRAELDSFSNGGKLDAFRHAFFMAAFAQKVKPRKIRKLGIAHEKANYKAFRKSELENGELADSLSNVMDLKNNEVGIVLGKDNKEASLEELQLKVIKEIKSGKAVIMKRKRSGVYLDCENRELNLNAFSKKWNIPKCLVASDLVYID